MASKKQLEKGYELWQSVQPLVEKLKAVPHVTKVEYAVKCPAWADNEPYIKCRVHLEPEKVFHGVLASKELSAVDELVYRHGYTASLVSSADYVCVDWNVFNAQAS